MSVRICLTVTEKKHFHPMEKKESRMLPVSVKLKFNIVDTLFFLAVHASQTTDRIAVLY